MYWTVLWKALVGDLPGIVNSILGIFGKLSDNDTARLLSGVTADKEIATKQLEVAAQTYHDKIGMGVTQWLMAAALIPPIVHMGAVIMDSVPFPFHKVGSWGVPSPPAPYDAYEWQMVASLLGIQTALTLGLGLTKALLRRR